MIDRAFSSAQAEMAARSFADLLAPLPQVRRILVRRRPDANEVWTLIHATPFAWEAREPIYEAQLATLLRFPQAALTFWLVNLAEYEGESVGDVIPDDTEVLLQR